MIRSLPWLGGSGPHTTQGHKVKERSTSQVVTWDRSTIALDIAELQTPCSFAWVMLGHVISQEYYRMTGLFSYKIKEFMALGNDIDNEAIMTPIKPYELFKNTE